MNLAQTRILAALALSLSALSLPAAVIDFSAPGGTWQTAYDTAQVDVAFQSPVQYWNFDYNDLVDVAYAGQGQSLVIDFIPTAGSAVSLQGFDLGNYIGHGAASQYQVYDLSNLGTPLISVSGLTVPYTTTSHSTFSVNLSSANGLRLSLGPDLYNIGVDNIAFSASVAAVPEQASLLPCALLLLTFAVRPSRRSTSG